MAEPVSLATAKLHLRVTSADEDALIAGYIVAARQWVENYTGHILVRREVTDTFDRFTRHLELTKRPYVGPAIVSYVDADGVPQTYAAPFVAEGRYPIRVYPEHNSWWPTTRVNTLVQVSYTAGYEADAVPQPLIQAILLLVGAWFERRSAVSEDRPAEVPFAVTALCDQYRAPGL